MTARPARRASRPVLGVACLVLAASLQAAVGASPVVWGPALSMQSAIQDFGAVIDIRRIGADGVAVLAVTPGGPAERLGLRPGDRILAINDRPVSETHSPSAALMSAAAADGGRLRLAVVRDGKRMALAGNAPPRSPAPAEAGCGYVSETGAPPRSSQRIFPARLTRIDGRGISLLEVNRHRVDAGRRVLVVEERIDAHRFSDFGLQERRRQLARQGARRHKVLIVDVEPGTRYEIGARLLTGALDIGAIRDNSYWEPVVWRESAEACR